MGRFSNIAMPWRDDPMSMDFSHAKMLGEFVHKIDAMSVVEVGCCYGVSTGAVLDAMEAGPWWIPQAKPSPFALRRLRHMHLIDIRFTDSVGRMAIESEAYPGGVVIDRDECLSTATRRVSSGDTDHRQHILGEHYGDVVILDGDHSLQNVQAEVEILMAWPTPPRAIVLHDSGRDGLPGPRWATEFLPTMGWNVVTNDDPSLGARTSRGLSFCVRGREEHMIAIDVLKLFENADG